jgi:hypothetical protein
MQKAALDWIKCKERLSSLDAQALVGVIETLVAQSPENLRVISAVLEGTEPSIFPVGRKRRDQGTARFEPESLQKLAKEYGYHAEYLRQLAAKGRLRARLIGHSWMATRADLEDYMRSRQTKGWPKKPYPNQK